MRKPTIPQLVAERKRLEDRLKNNDFVFSEWISHAELYPPHSKARRELKKFAARIEKERRENGR